MTRPPQFSTHAVRVSDKDNVPPWLQKFFIVKGEIQSTHADLPDRLDELIRAIKKEGWGVVVRSIDTDVSDLTAKDSNFVSKSLAGFLSFLAQARMRPFELYIRKEGATTQDARQLIRRVSSELDSTYRIEDKMGVEYLNLAKTGAQEKLEIAGPALGWGAVALAAGAVFCSLLKGDK